MKVRSPMSLEQAILEAVRALPADKQQEVLSHAARLRGEAAKEKAIQEREGTLGQPGNFALCERDRGEPARHVERFS